MITPTTTALFRSALDLRRVPKPAPPVVGGWWTLVAVVTLFLTVTAQAQHLGNSRLVIEPPTTPMPTVTTGPTADKLFTQRTPAAERELYALDIARDVKYMDATPDGSRWFVVDAFANWQRITINGRESERYHEIPSSGTQLSPNGEFLIWTGQFHGFTKYGFDSTRTILFKDTTRVGAWVSDYPSLEFSRSGRRWAALLPFAYDGQTGERDVVVVDGHVAHSGLREPHQFSFSHDEQHWAYRGTEGLMEKLMTDQSDSATLLYRRSVSPSGAVWDPSIWHYTPDVSAFGNMLEGRDYEHLFEHTAKQYRTAYSTLAADTLRRYINYKGRNHGLYRWINNILIDTSGEHIVYFAADPKTLSANDSSDERRAVVVYDGSIVAGPYPGVSSLYLSPSGKHYAYTLYRGCVLCGHKEIGKFYVDKKLQARTSQVLRCVWSPDETRTALVVSGEHDKVFVAIGKQRSPLYEHIGRVGWTADGKTVRFTAVRNGKVLAVTLAAEKG